MFVWICREEKRGTYISITVRVGLTVRVTSVAGVSTPGPGTADLSWAGLIGVTLLLLLCRPQGAQAWSQQIALQSEEGGRKMKRAEMDWHRKFFFLTLKKQLWLRVVYLRCAGYWFLPPLCIIQRTLHVSFGFSALLQSSNKKQEFPLWNVHIKHVFVLCLLLMKFPPSTSPGYPLWHFIDHHSAAPGQQVPLRGHLTSQGIMLHLPHAVHLPTSAWFSSRRRRFLHLCFITR